MFRNTTPRHVTVLGIVLTETLIAFYEMFCKRQRKLKENQIFTEPTLS
jgi:hypothetical protein